MRAPATSPALGHSLNTRPAPLRFLVLSLLVPLIIAGLWSCGSDAGDPDKTKTYSAHGITFDYPANWKKKELESKTAKAANAQWNLDGILLTEDDVIAVQAYKLTLSITPAVFRDNQQDIIAEVSQVTAGHEVLSDPEVTEVAGLPAITYSVSATSTGGKDVISQLFFVFKDDLEYFINCQATEKRLDEVEAACHKVVDSFAIK